PLANLGLGSSAGGACYLEQQFPALYRGKLFFCEWGKSVVCYQPQRAGSAFAPLKETTFAAGEAKDPYGFRPTRIVVQRAGTMMVADSADGQRPKRGRGRIYRIAYVGDGSVKVPVPRPLGLGLGQWLVQLDSDSYAIRCDAQTAIERQGPSGRNAL